MKPIRIRDKIHHDRICNIKQLAEKDSFRLPTYNSNLLDLRRYLGTTIFFLPLSMKNLQRIYKTFCYASGSSFDFILSFSKFKERHLRAKQSKFNRSIKYYDKNSIKDKSSKAFLTTIKDQVR